MIKPTSAAKPAGNAPAPAPAAAAANEDSPEAGQLYRLINKRPSRSIPYVAALLSLFAAGAVLAYMTGRFTGPAALPSTLAEAAPLLAAVLAPVIIIWLFAWLIWRGQEMRLMAEALARTALRITEPDETARERAKSLAASVRHELLTLQNGMDALLANASHLSQELAENIDTVDRSATRTEMRTADLVRAIEEGRASLDAISRALGSEADTVRQAIREQNDDVRALTGSAEEVLKDAAEKLRLQTETLARVSEAAATGADSTATMLDKQSSRLEVVAESALGKADTLAQRYEKQRETMRETVDGIEKEREALDAAFTRQRETIETTTEALRARTKEINESVSKFASELDHALEAADKRAKALGTTLKQEAGGMSGAVEDAAKSITEAAETASHKIGQAAGSIRASSHDLETGLQGTTGTISSAYKALREEVDALSQKVESNTAALKETLESELAALTGRFGEETAGLEKAAKDTMTGIHDHIEEKSKDARETLHDAAVDMEKLSEQLNSAMFRLGGAAKDAGRSLHEATDDLQKRIDELPAEATEGAKALREVIEEQIEVLASIADIVVRNARVFDRTAAVAPRSAAAPMPPYRGEPLPPAPAGMQADSRWSLSDLLSAARKSETKESESARGPQKGGDLSRASLHIIETLQSLAIDLDRALEQSPPPELWRRYHGGERNIFTRRLYNLQGRNLHDKIAERYESDREFRQHVDKFIGLFEELLAAAGENDRENILLDTYLTSDTGKVYLMLAQASGHLS
ncbi:hypothetical protein [Tepidicaulis sp.]|uniref:hypothetical protein n=1 Tax=Tepidicaulis sp. TaxID=1920809 RepID=UPI003B5C2C7A